MVKLAASLMCADLYRLPETLAQLEAGGVALWHVDVMDGHYVPNFSLGPEFLRSLRPHTTLPIETHLMVERPEQWLDLFAGCGTDYLTVHAEATPHLYRALRGIRERGLKAGVALEPATPVEVLRHLWGDVDLVLVMTVESGFRGQSLVPFALEKVRRLSRFVRREGLPVEVAVDGAMRGANLRVAAVAGADYLVAGAALFDTGPDLAANCRAALASATSGPG